MNQEQDKIQEVAGDGGGKTSQHFVVVNKSDMPNNGSDV